MIRVLVMIAVTGFLVCIVTLSIAIGIGGPEAMARGGWSWSPHSPWVIGGRSAFEMEGDLDRHDQEGPQGVRKLAWTGGDALSVDVPAEITYTQGAGPATLTITGPKSALDDLELLDGHLRLRNGSHHHGRRHGQRLEIVMTAPNVTRFALDGDDDLTILGYRQDRLALDVSGHAEVTVTGQAKRLDLQISGSADTDLSDLKLEDAKVDITGSGEAIIAPTASAELTISGSGEVTLLTNPPKVETDVSGSGRVHHAERAMPATPAAPTSAKARPGQT